MLGSFLPAKFAKVIDMDRLAVAKEHYKDRQTNPCFGCRHGQDEKDKDLAVDIAQEMRKGNKVGIDRQQHQLNAHQEHDEVLAVEENSHDANQEKRRR